MIVVFYFSAGVLFTAYAMNFITHKPEQWWGLPDVLKKDPIPMLSACLYFTVMLVAWPGYLVVHLIGLMRH